MKAIVIEIAGHQEVLWLWWYYLQIIILVSGEQNMMPKLFIRFFCFRQHVLSFQQTQFIEKTKKETPFGSRPLPKEYYIQPKKDLQCNICQCERNSYNNTNNKSFNIDRSLFFISCCISWPNGRKNISNHYSTK